MERTDERSIDPNLQFMKIVYILGSNYYPNGMSQVITQKMNYLAIHTNHELYAILTEKENMPMYYNLNEKIHTINFDINFDDIDTMPFHKKIYYYGIKQIKYKKLLTKYLLDIRADIVVSILRREINFINDINDGSIKIGEIHFNKGNYREFKSKLLPQKVNLYITKYWRYKLVKEIKKLKIFIVLTNEDYLDWKELQNVIVIPNPIQKYPDKVSDCMSRSVIAAGRYTWQKGFDFLIHAWKYVNERHPNWELNIYGNGDNNLYQSIANNLNLRDSITCHPATNNLYQKYNESSIFVLSSRYEGFGLVIAEAMSCGLPCVSFACPCGPKDIITDGKNGFLVEPENIEALAERICQLIENEELRKDMGKEARKRAEDFTEEKIMCQWVDLFENIS